MEARESFGVTRCTRPRFRSPLARRVSCSKVGREEDEEVLLSKRWSDWQSSAGRVFSDAAVRREDPATGVVGEVCKGSWPIEDARLVVVSVRSASQRSWSSGQTLRVGPALFFFEAASLTDLCFEVLRKHFK